MENPWSLLQKPEKGWPEIQLDKGLFNYYELMYVWATPDDELVRRAVVAKNSLYIYPLKLSQNGRTELFLQIAKTSLDLADSPRFYSTLTSNCTDELAKNANRVKPGTISYLVPEMYLTGYAQNYLYDLGVY